MQATDAELMNAMSTLRKFMIRHDDGSWIAKSGLEMLVADAKNELLRLRETRTTWVGAGELQVRMVCDKFIKEVGLVPNVESDRRSAATDLPEGDKE
jgi:hypothetical protein